MPVAQQISGKPPSDQIDWAEVDRLASAMAEVVLGENSANAYTATLIVVNAILLAVATEFAAQTSANPMAGARYLHAAHQAAPDLLSDLTRRGAELLERSQISAERIN